MDLSTYPIEELRDLKAAVELAKMYAMKLDQPASYGSFLRWEVRVEKAISEAGQRTKDEKFEAEYAAGTEQKVLVTVIDEIPY
jgi:hypothetical protein